MTDESTMMPKSTAPIDNKFADLPRRYSTEKENNSASGMLIATMTAVRTLLRNISKMTDTSTMPTSRFSRTVSVVRSIRCVRSQCRSRQYARQHRAMTCRLSWSTVALMSFSAPAGPLASLLPRSKTMLLNDATFCVDPALDALVVDPAPADADHAHARLIFDHDAAFADFLAAAGQRAAVDELVDLDWSVIVAGDDDAAQFLDALPILAAQEPGCFPGGALDPHAADCSSS